MKLDWKRNLYIAWIGCFFTGASFSLVMPFIPVYIRELGAPKDRADFYAGLAISVTALAAAIFAPIWGNLADRRGRKLMMIRAAAGMTITMGALAFVQDVYTLLIMRTFTGVLSGYIPNATAMIASQVPPEKNGWALGTLSTGAVAGNLIGPLMGGFLAQTFGIRNVFLITGGILFISLILTIVYIKEDFVPVKKENVTPTKELFKNMERPSLLFGLFITTFILQLGITSISPILTVFITEIGGNQPNILLISGMIVSVAGVSAFIASPFLGKLGDRYGNHNVLMLGLLAFMLCILPMSLVQTPFQLGMLRFLMGFSTGALMPSINSIISKVTPREGVSRVFAYNQVSQNMGQVMGPLVGSTVAMAFSYRAVFIVTGMFIFFNLLVSYVNFRGTIGKRSFSRLENK